MRMSLMGTRLGDLIISIDKTYKIIYTVNNIVYNYFLYCMEHAAEFPVENSTIRYYRNKGEVESVEA